MLIAPLVMFSATSLAHTVLVPLTDLPGVPESTLPSDLTLPSTTPGPPWVCQVEATVWWHRATPAAGVLVPSGMPLGLPVTVGAFVTYLDTPVGPYREVLASPHLLAGALHRRVLARVHIPFIAVDSLASVQGGRAHWALPKALARFDGSHAHGDGWEVYAAARLAGPWLPVRARLGSTQVDARGRVSHAVTSTRVQGRLATVEVGCRSEGDLPTWLVPGRHRGLVLRGHVTVGPASSD
jgi:hypothetical protein